MKYDLTKLSEDAKREYWENAYKNKLKDIYNLEMVEQWLGSKEGVESVGLEKAENGRLKAKRDLVELKTELKFLEKIMG